MVETPKYETLPWEMNIKRVENGFILSHKDYSIEEGKQFTSIKEKVIEEEEDDELDVFRRMLLEVKEYFGSFHSKHNNKNLVIEIKSG